MSVLVVLLAATAGYLMMAVFASRRVGWLWHRVAFWIAGLGVVGTAFLALPAHGAFSEHVLKHLLLGMLAPLLLVLAAPVTLLLRALPAHSARNVARALSAWPVVLLTHPVTASVLHVGALWLLYTVPAAAHLHHSPVVQLHMLAAGYLFAAAFVGVDPAPHRPRPGVLVVVLVAALAAHSVLAKRLYAFPPVGVKPDEARSGALLLYYGGDAVDMMLIAVFCWQWYQAAVRRVSGPPLASPG